MPLSSLKPIALTFGDRFHLDLVDMPKSSAGHVAICTIVDAATGFVIVHPCLDKTHTGVIDALRTKVYPNFGCPKLLVTDRGKEMSTMKSADFFEITMFHTLLAVLVTHKATEWSSTDSK